LLSYFKSIYHNRGKSYEIPEGLIEKPFKKTSPPYYLASLECIVDRKCLSTGYHTSCVPSSGNCDHCKQALSNETIILICGHGYHNRCYSFLEKSCKWCQEYYEKGINDNVKSFLKRLNKNVNELTAEEEEENLEEEDDGSVVSINLNESNGISYEVQTAIDNVKDW
jgi:hypothetical protein